MAIGTVKVFTVTMGSGSTFSNEVDLGRAYSRVIVDPTGAASEVRFQVAPALSAAGGTYRQLYHPTVNSSAAQNNIVKLASAMSGGLCDVPGGYQYMKVELTAAVANGTSFKIICGDV